MVGRFAFLVFVSSALLMSGVTVRADAPSFSRDILPILSENCFFCHGQDAEGAEGGPTAGRGGGCEARDRWESPIVPGKSGQSTIMERMLTHETDDVMPPPKSNRKVTPAQIELIGNGSIVVRTGASTGHLRG